VLFIWALILVLFMLMLALVSLFLLVNGARSNQRNFPSTHPQISEGSKGLVATLYFKQGLVYAGYTDGCVRVWKDGEWKGSYRGHQGTVLCLTIVGREMFTGSKDQTIMTWNLRDAKPHVIWRGKLPQNGAIRGVEVHRGTVWFADANRILAQNIATGARVFKCEGHDSVIKRIILHAPTDSLYSIAEDKSIRVWDTNTGQQKAICSGHTGVINAICVDDRGFLYSGAADNTVREWATESLIDAAAAANEGGASSGRAPPRESAATSTRDSSLDDPPKPRKAAPKRGMSTATITKNDRDSSGGGTPTRVTPASSAPKKEAPKRSTAAAAAPKSSELEELEPLDDNVPLEKIDDVTAADWDDIDNLLDFGDL
jgi:WD40 repeat protein